MARGKVAEKRPAVHDPIAAMTFDAADQTPAANHQKFDKAGSRIKPMSMVQASKDETLPLQK
jgi:hypothetical protein